MSKVLGRKVWETRVGYTFAATSLLAFVLVLFLPRILFQELLVWILFQVCFWATISMYPPLIAWRIAWPLIAFTPLMLGPSIFVLAYPYFSLVLVGFSGLGFVAAFGLLRTKKWGTPLSIVFAFLAACLTLSLFSWFDLITVPKAIIQIITLITFIIYAGVLFKFREEKLSNQFWEVSIAYIFVATSLSAFVMASLLGPILLLEMWAWVSLFQVGLWTILATTPITIYDQLDKLMRLYLYMEVLKSSSVFGPEILYPNHYFSCVLFSSIVLSGLGGLGLAAAFSLLRTKKWGPYASYVFSLLVWPLALYIFLSFEMLTIPRSIIQFASLPIFVFYFYIWVFLAKITLKGREEEKSN
ncbi:MAG: hypothetical protein KIH10_11495 [Candidatus Freyarchaeota archaeon]|nr:hypothetical protein [Candidatus Jordarchaeia archaeon]MBS7279777.1 hypothetical protein [Candidatus Jordarchaeia archaeon]